MSDMMENKLEHHPHLGKGHGFQPELQIYP